MKQIIYNQLEEHRLAGWLVFTAMRLETLADRYMFKPLGLTTASFRILMMLYKSGPQAPSEIIEILGGTKSNATQRLNWLNRRGLIELTHKEGDDKRRASARITTLGRQQVDKASRLFKDNDLHIEKYFSNNEMKDFMHLLRKLNLGLDQCEVGITKLYEKK